MNSSKKDIHLVRDRLVNVILVAVAILGCMPVAASLSRVRDLGWHNIMFIHIGAYATVVVTAVLRRRVAFVLRSVLVLGILLLLGISSLLSWGLIGGGVLLLMTGAVLTTVLFGTRAGVIATAVSVVLVALTGFCVVTEIVTFDFDLHAYATSMSPWLTRAITLGFFLSLVVLGVGTTHKRLIEVVEDLNTRTSEQLRTYEQLKSETKERKEAEGQLRQAQKMEAVGQLAGGVAHDFNNLLLAIRGYTGLATATLPEESAARTHLGEVTKAAERASTLVRQLLTFSRREAARPRLLDLGDAIDDVMSMVQRIIGEHIELKISRCDDLRKIYADPGQVEQVLINLCVNSRHAMPDGGVLKIGTDNVDIDREFAEKNPWAKQGSYVRLTVADTGVGMPPRVVEHIFEPFFTTKEVGQGTGLGLATVYGTLKQHDGLIRVDSAVGKGARFELYFPVDKSRQDAPEPSGYSPGYVGGSETILIAEDDELVRNLTVEILSNAGYSMIVACDGEEAVRLFMQKAEEIQCLLFDVVMPRMNGRAAYEKIKLINPDIPILFMSGYSYNTLENGSEFERQFELMQKPFEPKKLLAKIRDLLAPDPQRA